MKQQEVKKTEQTGPVFERPHATRAQRRGVMKQMPQWKMYKDSSFMSEGSIEFREAARKR